ncbi:MAG: DoxX family protein [Verrucomicrobiaceae bacterium]|nr:MAG: DoxX family protein [Verrucomicrobiaceae bacterium]
MKKFFFDCGTRDLTASLGIFVLRVSIGLMMLLGHGLDKIKAFGTKKDAFPVPDLFPLKYMTPPISMMATIGAEVVAAGLLIIGLATRPAAFVLSFTMVIAAFQIHHSDPFLVKEKALLYLAAVVTVLLTGAGSWSLDATLCKEKRRRW